MKHRLWELLYLLLREVLEEERDLHEDADEIRATLVSEGFSEEEVGSAFHWLDSYFRSVPPEAGDEARSAAPPRSLRVLSFDEGMHISPEAHGFLLELEARGVIPPDVKEEILHRSMQMFEEVVGVEEMKMVTLLTIFEQGVHNLDELVRLVDGGRGALLH